jgi:RNA polymerase sigma factor (sigma-70 family)
MGRDDRRSAFDSARRLGSIARIRTHTWEADIYEPGEIDDWFVRNVLPHEADLRRWLMRFAPDLDGDDVIQEAYAKLAREYRNIRNPRAYLFTVARNVVMETLRQRRIIRIVAIADLDSLPVFDEGQTSEQALIGRQELDLLQAALAQLPSRCREVLTLRKVEGLSQREVAARLGLSESTVEKHVASGLRRCAAWLGRNTRAVVERGARDPKAERKQ